MHACFCSFFFPAGVHPGRRFSTISMITTIHNTPENPHTMTIHIPLYNMCVWVIFSQNVFFPFQTWTLSTDRKHIEKASFQEILMYVLSPKSGASNASIAQHKPWLLPHACHSIFPQEKGSFFGAAGWVKKEQFVYCAGVCDIAVADGLLPSNGLLCIFPPSALPLSSLSIFLSHLLSPLSFSPPNSLFSLFSAQVSNVMSEQWPIVFYWAAHVRLSISLPLLPSPYSVCLSLTRSPCILSLWMDGSLDGRNN